MNSKYLDRITYYVFFVYFKHQENNQEQNKMLAVSGNCQSIRREFTSPVRIGPKYIYSLIPLSSVLSFLPSTHPN